MADEWPQHLPAGWLVDQDRAEAERDGRLRRLLERYVCPCDPNPETTEGPLQECPIHGDPDVAEPALEAVLTFHASIFSRSDYDAGVRWGRQVAGMPEVLTDERVTSQGEHYANRVTSTSVLLSRLLGRLAGYRQAAAERLDGQPTIPDRYRLPEFRVITGGGA